MIPSFNLAGRTALITGASSGLGERFARILAAQGVRVAACARRRERLEALAESVGRTGGQILPVTMDVESPDSIKAGFDDAVRALGPVDIVIANAGVGADGLALDVSDAAIQQLTRINVDGVFFTAREGARRMIAGPAPARGRIILIGSIASFRPLAGLTFYSASKAAVAMMGRGLAREWARHGVTVNTICPGYIATEINDEWLASDAGQKLVKTFPRRRIMDAEGLDGLILYLASDLSAAITGGVFAADEGQAQA